MRVVTLEIAAESIPPRFTSCWRRESIGGREHPGGCKRRPGHPAKHRKGADRRGQMVRRPCWVYAQPFRSLRAVARSSRGISPRVLAFSPSLAGIDATVRDGDTLRMGDQLFEVIHTPGHSSDSICLYNEAEGVLFAGDTPLLISSSTGSYEAGFKAALEKLCARDVRRIYFGHGPPLTERCNERLRESQRIAASCAPANEGRGTMNYPLPVAAK